jgi:hypothetical protein
VKSLLAVLVFLASMVAQAADVPALVLRDITKPSTTPVADDPLHADYEKMWAEYDRAVTHAVDAVTASLDQHLAKATQNGDLESVELWDGLRKRFIERGAINWEWGSRTSSDWKKKYPKSPYPREFNECFRNASAALASAKTKLAEGYANLVTAYTKAKNIQRAKELREERATLLPEKPPRQPTEAETPAGAAVPDKVAHLDRLRNLRVRHGGKWIVFPVEQSNGDIIITRTDGTKVKADFDGTRLGWMTKTDAGYWWFDFESKESSTGGPWSPVYFDE